MTITTCILHEHTVSAIQTVLCVWVIHTAYCGLAETNKKGKQLQFSYHYGEVKGLSNVPVLQGLIKIKKEEKEILPKKSKHLSWVK